MSRLSTVSRLISLCECSATVCGSCRASTGSISTAVTRDAAVQQRQRQRAQAGTHLEDVVVAVDPGRRHDAAHGVGVMDEVLAERLPRPEVKFLGQMPDLGAPEEPNRQRAPTLPLHTGQAPQP